MPMTERIEHSLLARQQLSHVFKQQSLFLKTQESWEPVSQAEKGSPEGVTLSCDLQDQWDSIKLQGEGAQEESTPNILCKCQHMKIKSGQKPCLSDKGSKETILVVFVNLSETQTYRKASVILLLLRALAGHMPRLCSELPGALSALHFCIRCFGHWLLKPNGQVAEKPTVPLGLNLHRAGGSRPV